MSKAHPPELKKFMDKKLSIKLNAGRAVTGVLRGFDPFMNLVLDESVEECKDGQRNNIGMVNPRGKWYCANCVSRAPPKKPRNTKKRESRHKDSTGDLDHSMVPSPAPSHASTSTTAEDCSASVTQTPEKCGEGDKMADVAEPENGIVHHPAPPDFEESDGPSPEKRRATSRAMELDDSGEAMDSMDGSELDAENVPLLSRAKKEKTSARRAKQDLASCKNLLSCLECHEHAWPFLLPVNTKQFPQYKKAIKTPMDLSTIKRKLQEGSYKHKGEFASDVRLIFSNCEEFNEDYSPVGRAGHCMRQYFEQQWAQM